MTGEAIGVGLCIIDIRKGGRFSMEGITVYV